ELVVRARAGLGDGLASAIAAGLGSGCGSGVAPVAGVRMLSVVVRRKSVRSTVKSGPACSRWVLVGVVLTVGQALLFRSPQYSQALSRWAPLSVAPESTAPGRYAATNVAPSRCALAKLQPMHCDSSKWAPVSGAPVRSKPPPWCTSPARSASVKS